MDPGTSVFLNIDIFTVPKRRRSQRVALSEDAIGSSITKQVRWYIRLSDAEDFQIRVVDLI